MSDAEEDQGYQSRSRSASRRRRRQNQRQRQVSSKAQAGDNKASAKAETIQEDDEEPQSQQFKPASGPTRQPGEQLVNPHPSDVTEMQPFERIKPPSESMNGPVTYARAMRGEIPMRGAPPTQEWSSMQKTDAKGGGGDMMDQDGLKLRLELNLDIEIELKASIHGDLTLALL